MTISCLSVSKQYLYTFSHLTNKALSFEKLFHGSQTVGIVIQKC